MRSYAPPPPAAHCHRAGFGHRMENGLIRVENTDKMLALLEGLGYNNSVKFTRWRGDNLVTNDSMVMKVSYAQLHIHSNIMCKF